MTKYGRSYTPPVFHITNASTDQIELMETVFETLQESGIDFVIVRNADEADTLNVISNGDIKYEEMEEILEEIQDVYGTE